MPKSPSRFTATVNGISRGLGVGRAALLAAAIGCAPLAVGAETRSHAEVKAFLANNPDAQAFADRMNVTPADIVQRFESGQRPGLDAGALQAFAGQNGFDGPPGFAADVPAAAMDVLGGVDPLALAGMAGFDGPPGFAADFRAAAMDVLGDVDPRAFAGMATFDGPPPSAREFGAALALRSPAFKAYVDQYGIEKATEMAWEQGAAARGSMGDMAALALAAPLKGGGAPSIATLNAGNDVAAPGESLGGSVDMGDMAAAFSFPEHDREGAVAEAAILREFDLDAVAAAADRLADRNAAAEIHTVIAALERIEERATGPRLPARFQTGFVVIPDLVAYDPNPEPKPGAQEARVHTPLTLGRVQFN